MSTLKLHTVQTVDHLSTPSEPTGLTLESPALLFFTDFQKTPPLTINWDLSAIDAKSIMISTHVRLKFVTDNGGHFIGIITADSLADRKVIQKVSQGSERSEILVTDLMTCKSELKALDYDEVAKSRISDVISTLKDSGEQHCLVICQKDHEIRGIISASDISRKLHLPIFIQSASSFYRVFSATNTSNPLKMRHSI